MVFGMPPSVMKVYSGMLNYDEFMALTEGVTQCALTGKQPEQLKDFEEWNVLKKRCDASALGRQCLLVSSLKGCIANHVERVF